MGSWALISVAYNAMRLQSDLRNATYGMLNGCSFANVDVCLELAAQKGDVGKLLQVPFCKYRIGT